MESCASCLSHNKLLLSSVEEALCNTPHVLLAVQSSASQALDALTVPLHDWGCLAGSRSVPAWLKHALRLGQGSFLGRHLMKQLAAFLCESTALALAFAQVKHPSRHRAMCTCAWHCSLMCTAFVMGIKSVLSNSAGKC